jgi:hypothetical protein
MDGAAKAAPAPAIPFMNWRRARNSGPGKVCNASLSLSAGVLIDPSFKRLFMNPVKLFRDKHLLGSPKVP